MDKSYLDTISLTPDDVEELEERGLVVHVIEHESNDNGERRCVIGRAH